MPIVELARAKINLTLTVLGRRADGYHELESLVAFADAADQVVFQPGLEPRVVTTGPFALEISGGNLVQTALGVLHDLGAGLQLGSVALTKNLPVAAGLGGGSADAAALLRAVRTANPGLASAIAWQDIAARLGADVPVCLAGKPALMWGIGEKIDPLGRALPSLPVVLVNPRMPLSTARVFAALQASPAPARTPPDWQRSIAGADALLDVMRARGNDLERPAAALLPVILEMKAALAAQPQCRLAALSGSGPTCFGIFPDEAAAERAAVALQAAHPHWWIVATRLAGA